MILNEDAQHKKDLLTNFDLVGNQALSRPLTAQRIRDSLTLPTILGRLKLRRSLLQSLRHALPSETATDDTNETARV